MFHQMSRDLKKVIWILLRLHPISPKVVVSIFVSSMVIALCCFRRIFKNPATDQRVREGVLRYVDSGAFIDRSGV
jgi:hypothetical protein